MREWLRFLSLVGVLCALGFARAADKGVKEPQPPPLPPQAKEISVEEMGKLLEQRKDIFVLDVRTIEEVREEGVVPGSKHLDYFNPEFEKALPRMGIDVAKPCIVYCAFGGRARRAAQKLARLGCREILLPSGGFNAWKKAGMPVAGGAAQAKP